MQYKRISLFLLILISAFSFAEDCGQPVFTTDWFSNNIKDWDQYKDEFYNKPDQYCLEIGSWEGRSSLYIASNYCNAEGSHLICIDTWEGSHEHSSDLTKNLYERFLHNTGNYIKNDKIIAYKGMSKDVLFELNHKLHTGSIKKCNFIYIDGSHDAKDVLLDAVLAWELLNIGGIMIFDDYGWGNGSYRSPKPAIEGFLASYQSMYKILKKGYQLHIRKIGDLPVQKKN